MAAPDEPRPRLDPRLVDSLAGLVIGARRPMGGARQGLHRSARHGASVEFAEYRPYVPGDAPALIDWAAYARTDRHLVRRFEEETALTGWVLLDCSGSMGWAGRGGRAKLDAACALAAGAMQVLIGQGDRAGLCAFSAGLVATHAPAGTPAALKPALEALGTIPCAGAGDIAAALHAACLVMARRSLVVVLSDCLQAPAALSAAFAHLAHDGHDVRLLHLIDRDELALAGDGLVELHDLETGERLEVDLDEAREAYRAAVAAHLDEVRRVALASRVDYRRIDTATPVATALRELA
jgi:uncharacterized protein (DUF58 family)